MQPFATLATFFQKTLGCVFKKSLGVFAVAALVGCQAPAASLKPRLSQVAGLGAVHAISSSNQGLMVVSDQGLLHLSNPTKILAQKVSPNTMPIAAFGGIGFAHQDGRFCVASTQVVCSDVLLSAHANLLGYKQAVFGTDQHGNLIKITQGTHGFAVQKSPITLLPDAQIALKDGVLFALGEPTLDYRHGVLGDGVEAKTLYAFDENLAIIDQMRATDGLVFEANRVDFWGKHIVTTLSGDGLGARVALIDFDGKFGKLKHSKALSHQRWQSPFVFDGDLYSVQMPHIQGDLVRFDDNLNARKISDTALSNHAYGSYHTNLALTQPKLVIPTIDRKALVVLDKNQSLLPLPARVHQSAYDSHDQKSYFVLENGQLWVLEI